MEGVPWRPWSLESGGAQESTITGTWAKCSERQKAGCVEASGALRRGMQARKLLKELRPKLILAKGTSYPREEVRVCQLREKRPKALGVCVCVCVCVCKLEKEKFSVSSMITSCMYPSGFFS